MHKIKQKQLQKHQIAFHEGKFKAPKNHLGFHFSRLNQDCKLEFHLVSVKQQRSKYLQKTGFFRSPRDLLIEKKVSKSFKQETKASKSFKQETKANEFTNT